MSTENTTATTSNVTPWGSYILRIAIGLFLVALLLAYGMSFQVTEGTQTVVTRFNRPIRTVKEAGLYWKLPWPIEEAHSIDMRKRIFNTPQVSTMTKDQLNVLLLTYVTWEVEDPLLYLESLGRGEKISEKDLIENAQKAMEGVVVASKNRVVGNYELSSLFTTEEEKVEEAAKDDHAEETAKDDHAKEAQKDSNVEETAKDDHAEEAQKDSNAKKGEKKNTVEKIEDSILNDIKDSIRKDYGINVLQVGIKRISVPEENMKAILESMRAERVKLASELKAQGDKEADKIKKDADLRAEELQTAGRMEAGKIIGEAEQEATRIDAKANSYAPEFYSFWRSMQTLRNTLNGNATIVLRNDNEFFKLLFEEPNKGETPASAPTPAAPTP